MSGFSSVYVEIDWSKTKDLATVLLASAAFCLSLFNAIRDRKTRRPRVVAEPRSDGFGDNSVAVYIWNAGTASISVRRIDFLDSKGQTVVSSFDSATASEPIFLAPGQHHALTEKNRYLVLASTVKVDVGDRSFAIGLIWPENLLLRWHRMIRRAIGMFFTEDEGESGRVLKFRSPGGMGTIECDPLGFWQSYGSIAMFENSESNREAVSRLEQMNAKFPFLFSLRTVDGAKHLFWANAFQQASSGEAEKAAILKAIAATEPLLPEIERVLGSAKE